MALMHLEVYEISFLVEHSSEERGSRVGCCLS